MNKPAPTPTAELPDLEGKKVSESKTIMTEMIMPNDTNPLNDLMGGNLLRWMDVVAAITASKHCESTTVTASVDNVSFQRAIKMGEVVTLTAEVTRAFTTSVEVYVEVFAADVRGKNPRRCNHAYFTFVALEGEARNKQRVPPVIPLTAEEQQRYDSAVRRRELRLILGGRMEPKEAVHLRSFFDKL